MLMTDENSVRQQIEEIILQHNWGVINHMQADVRQSVQFTRNNVCIRVPIKSEENSSNDMVMELNIRQNHDHTFSLDNMNVIDNYNGNTINLLSISYNEIPFLMTSMQLMVDKYRNIIQMIERLNWYIMTVKLQALREDEKEAQV